MKKNNIQAKLICSKCSKFLDDEKSCIKYDLDPCYYNHAKTKSPEFIDELFPKEERLEKLYHEIYKGHGAGGGRIGYYQTGPYLCGPVREANEQEYFLHWLSCI